MRMCRKQQRENENADMGKIVYLMGKSSSGKDTIFKELMKEGTMDLRTIVPYTTRPIRDGEKNGVEYFFTDEAGFRALKDQGKIIEDRAYDTVYGIWRYFTADDGQIELTENSGRKSRSMRRCAGDFWRTAQIFPRRSWRQRGSGNDLKIQI